MGPSDKQACTQCRAGTFRAPFSAIDFCEECDAHTFSALPGATSCTKCEPCPFLVWLQSCMCVAACCQHRRLLLTHLALAPFPGTPSFAQALLALRRWAPAAASARPVLRATTTPRPAQPAFLPPPAALSTSRPLLRSRSGEGGSRAACALLCQLCQLWLPGSADLNATSAHMLSLPSQPPPVPQRCGHLLEGGGQRRVRPLPARPVHQHPRLPGLQGAPGHGCLRHAHCWLDSPG